MSITYYRGPDVVITGEYFVVWTPDPQSFRIDELDEVYVVSSAPSLKRFAFIAFAAVAFVVDVALWKYIRTPGAVFAATLMVVVPTVIGSAHGRFTQRGQELRAVYRGAEITLFSCTDPTTFGQVRRGLSRVLEGRRRNASTDERATYGH